MNEEREREKERMSKKRTTVTMESHLPSPSLPCEYHCSLHLLHDIIICKYL